MTDKAKAENTESLKHSETAIRGKKAPRAALWLGDGKRKLEMGWGRGPRTLDRHEFISWFFSRDGI